MITFVDIPSDEHADYVGMWCEIKSTGHLEVLAEVREVYGKNVFYLIKPTNPRSERLVPSSLVTPRPDLPRAWDKHGQPVGHNDSA
ncbi:hypothetical protein FRC0378_00152 [Corynebacterium diphtheriae]|nr:hypothetical protein FRC0378_00152 [Corynebacterium diphtheriae]